jgi:hypothetical protein
MNYEELENNLPTGWWATDAHAAARMQSELETELPQRHLLEGKKFTVDAIRVDDEFDLMCQDAQKPGEFTVVRFAPGTSAHLTVLFYGSFQGFLENAADGSKQFEICRTGHEGNVPKARPYS